VNAIIMMSFAESERTKELPRADLVEAILLSVLRIQCVLVQQLVQLA